MEITELSSGVSSSLSKGNPRQGNWKRRKIFIFHRRRRKLQRSKLIIHDDTGFGGERKAHFLFLVSSQPSRRKFFINLFFLYTKNTKNIERNAFWSVGHHFPLSWFSFLFIRRPHNLCSLNINTPRQDRSGEAKTANKIIKTWWEPSTFPSTQKVRERITIPLSTTQKRSRPTMTVRRDWKWQEICFSSISLALRESPIFNYHFPFFVLKAFLSVA